MSLPLAAAEGLYFPFLLMSGANYDENSNEYGPTLSAWCAHFAQVNAACDGATRSLLSDERYNELANNLNNPHWSTRVERIKARKTWTLDNRNRLLHKSQSGGTERLQLTVTAAHRILQSLHRKGHQDVDGYADAVTAVGLAAKVSRVERSLFACDDVCNNSTTPLGQRTILSHHGRNGTILDCAM
jgi:hypothetical protein